jgi:hypothetical protein
MVVINGPDATAGSILIFLNITGIIVPKNAEHTIAVNRAIPIQPEIRKASDGAVDVSIR